MYLLVKNLGLHCRLHEGARHFTALAASELGSEAGLACTLNCKFDFGRSTQVLLGECGGTDMASCCWR